jgi:hypothetical protein
MSDNAERADPNETALASDMGMRMVERMQQMHGRRMPRDEIEFAGMLGIAFMLGRESVMGNQMGEIADMMIDAEIFEGPRDDRPPHRRFAQPSNPAKVACTVCGRHVKAVGLDQHMRDKHGGPKPLAQQLNELEHEEQP